MKPNLKNWACCLLLTLPSVTHASAPVVEVYKTATCGCCEAWADHLKANGFAVRAHNVEDPGAYRRKFGIADALCSCHTAKVGGYAIEGHVPASDIKRLLESRAKARGLAVPGMPTGSPGMEAPQGDAYDVLLVQPDGRTRVYKHYKATR